MRVAARVEGSVHRTIAACQKRFLRVDEIARGPGDARYGKHAFTAKAK